MPTEPGQDFPVYHIAELLPAQLAAIGRLGNPAIAGSHETSIFLSDPRSGVRPPHYRDAGPDAVAAIGAAHAVTYTCPVVLVRERPQMVMPDGELVEVDLQNVGPTPDHWLPTGGAPA